MLLKRPRHKPQILDPSCGSETFVYAAIKRLDALTAKAHDPEEFYENPKIKARILNNLVAGIDLPPVAVELAKTTKLLALEEDPGGPLNIWLGDSLQWSRRPDQTLIDRGIIKIPTSDGDVLQLPEDFVISDSYEQDMESLVFVQTRELTGEQDGETVESITPDVGYQQAIESTIRTLRHYLISDRNGVWEWYLANVVQTFRLSKNKPARLVGNPPWVVFRNMSAARQSEMREQAKNHGVWTGGKLATQNDLASLFVASAVDLYLSDKCKFGFVLPYSALRARHWDPFREGKWDHKTPGKSVCANLYDAWNRSDVKNPPFKQSASCVIFGKKKAESDSRR